MGGTTEAVYTLFFDAAHRYCPPLFSPNKNDPPFLKGIEMWLSSQEAPRQHCRQHPHLLSGKEELFDVTSSNAAAAAAAAVWKDRLLVPFLILVFHPIQSKFFKSDSQ